MIFTDDMLDLSDEEGEVDARSIDGLIDLLTPPPSRSSLQAGGESSSMIAFGKMSKQKKKVDTSAKPNVRYEINRLARVFAGWLPPSMSTAERDRQEPTEPQLWAIIFALKGGVSVGQIADAVGVSPTRAQQIIRDAKNIQTQKESDGRVLRISGSSIPAPTEAPPTMAAHVMQKISITDTSPRIGGVNKKI